MKNKIRRDIELLLEKAKQLDNPRNEDERVLLDTIHKEINELINYVDSMKK